MNRAHLLGVPFSQTVYSEALAQMRSHSESAATGTG